MDFQTTPTRILFGLLFSIFIACQANADVSAKKWSAANIPQGGNNLTRICLSFQDGKWADNDPKNPNSCEEMLFAERDSRWVWPDKNFYQYQRKSTSSRLFDIKDSYSLGYLFETKPSIIEAMEESGALRRLEAEIASGISTPEQAKCIAAFQAAQTEIEVQSIWKDCKGYKEESIAYSRIRGAKEKDETALSESQAARHRPQCSSVRVSGVVVGGRPVYLADVAATRDVDALLAKNPLRCSPNGFSQTYTCDGATSIAERTGYIIGWGEDFYQVAIPVDLLAGRKDALLFVGRSSATCIDKKIPSLNFSENLKNFLKNNNRNR